MRMVDQAKILHEHNNELVKRIEDLCQKRDQIQKSIIQVEDEKNRIQHDMRLLAEKLAKANETLSQKLTLRSSYDKTIAESQAAYTKILESSHTLLTVLRREQEDMSASFLNNTRA
ncbi:Sjoegren syndrome nuclear autoantigen 1 [Paragonimus kellicotti]|nr:Sjoegren syndrome nuclear autoantigen 1 [Paragonimus kellicotti]